MAHLLITDRLDSIGLEVLNRYPNIDVETAFNLSTDALLEKIPTVDGLIVREGTPVSAELIRAGAGLKVIGTGGIDVDHIDLDAATEQGILVLHTPTAQAVSTAEHALGLMLRCARLQSTDSGTAGRQLQGETLGLIGFGPVARLLATRAHALGMTVFVYDPFVSEKEALDHPIELLDLEDLLASADVLSVHRLASGRLPRPIDANQVSQMKPGVMLLNVTAEKLIDPVTLKSDVISAIGLDLPITDRIAALSQQPHVVATSNIGANTAAAEQQVSSTIVEQVALALLEIEIRHPVNGPLPARTDYRMLKPYLDLAEKIGRLQTALAPHSIHKIEVEVSGTDLKELVRPIASGLLKGLLKEQVPSINRMNAPQIARANQIQISQEYGLHQTDYPNLVSCRVYWSNGEGDAGNRLISGVLFGGRAPRIVQVGRYQLEANPSGVVLLLRNRDVPGVIGQVATLLATYNVNIAEWRLGRTGRGEEALAFINLDGTPPQALIDALAQAPAVTGVKLVEL